MITPISQPIEDQYQDLLFMQRTFKDMFNQFAKSDQQATRELMEQHLLASMIVAAEIKLQKELA